MTQFGFEFGMRLTSALLIASATISAAVSAQAATTLTYSQTADNEAWPSAPTGYNTNSYETISTNFNGFTSFSGRQGLGFYDAFSIQANGNPNTSVSSLTLSFRFSGYFDDSVGLDLDGNGAIDYALPFTTIAAVNNSFAPWASLEDATNLGIVLTIGSTSTTAQAYLYGSLISPGGSAYYNNLSSISLATLGLASLDGTGKATSNGSIRIGYLNMLGKGGGTPTLVSSNFGFDHTQIYAVPEPSTYGLMLGGLALAAVAVRRRKSKQS